MNIVEHQPFLDEQGDACFRSIIAYSKCYLEYGSGGSTIYACAQANVPVVLSVDTDKNWIEKVRHSVAGTRSNLLIDHCDIGEVGAWGKPVSNERIADYWTYMGTPWRRASQHGCVPDLVLIDGRFRVASFLFSLLSAREGTAILFDDYMCRPYYSLVERFCPLKESHGRMGVFIAHKNYSVSELCEVMAQYSINYE